MKTAATLQRAIWIGLAILTITSGCTHNYYYGGVPGCPPYGQTVTTQVGQVCEVPAGTVVTSNGPGTVTTQDGVSSSVATQTSPQRVVISQPAYNPSFSSRLGWRKPPENVATTRVEGALSDSSMK